MKSFFALLLFSAPVFSAQAGSENTICGNLLICDTFEAVDPRDPSVTHQASFIPEGERKVRSEQVRIQGDKRDASSAVFSFSDDGRFDVFDPSKPGKVTGFGFCRNMVCSASLAPFLSNEDVILQAVTFHFSEEIYQMNKVNVFQNGKTKSTQSVFLRKRDKR